MSYEFSYSRLEVYNKCPFKYKLVYVDGHKIETDTVATEFGTLVHYIEEQIGLDIKNGKDVDYNHYVNLFMNINDDNAVGVTHLKNKYYDNWNEPNKQGLTYEDKALLYLEVGIYRLQRFLNNNTNLSIYALELEFEVTIMNRKFGGFIDRILYDKINNKYIIEDVKTYTKLLTNKELKSSLQMHVYTHALRNIIGDGSTIECQYNLPLCDKIQRSIIDINIVTEGLQDVFNGVDKKTFHPVQTPLCHWCVFSNTYPNQPAEAKNLCPYFCKWTRDNKTKNVENYWQGDERHQVILERFIKKENNK